MGTSEAAIPVRRAHEAPMWRLQNMPPHVLTGIGGRYRGEKGKERAVTVKYPRVLVYILGCLAAAKHKIRNTGKRPPFEKRKLL